MAKAPTLELPFDDDDTDEQDVAETIPPGSQAAVVTGTDWTTETIVTQLKRGNIQLDPKFQRRDAWRRDRKSRFIESLIVGLPIPQIVLAESKRDRGQFIVLDGKQRLLTIMQFWGLGQGDNNSFSLSSLTLRNDLAGLTFSALASNSIYAEDYSSLCNQPIRTVVIRNWKDTNFLHTVFLRLNTGSVKLSPQELRQALLPGLFSNFIDEVAGQSPALRILLGVDGPDPRMRDTEILARFLSFRFFAEKYPGRMKEFLDNTFEEFNNNWAANVGRVKSAIADFEKGIEDLVSIFGNQLARKPESPQFNRAIFDALIYFHSQSSVRSQLRSKKADIRKAYDNLFVPNSPFLGAIESDTAGPPNTSARLTIWAGRLSGISGQAVRPPKIPVATKAPPRPKKKPSRQRSK